MKLCVLALLFLLGLVNAQDRTCNLDKAVKSSINQYCQNTPLDCTYVRSQGSESTCPSGYAPTGCSCGMGCGSWDIKEKSRCHCQCEKMDWTAAVCCRNKCQ